MTGAEYLLPVPGAEWQEKGEKAGDDEVDKEGADGTKTETIHLVPGMEYTFVVRYALVLDATRTKGTPFAAQVTEQQGYHFLGAAQAGMAAQILGADYIVLAQAGMVCPVPDAGYLVAVRE